MKTSILILLTAYLALMSCGTKTQSEKQQTAATAEQPTDCVEVLYFHGKQRCATCMAIEQNTKALIDSLYADQVAAMKKEAGEYLIPLSEGLITEDHIVGSIGEVLLGKAPGRQSEEEITLFDALGLAVEDVNCGRYLVCGE